MIANPPGSNGSQFLIFFKDFNPAEPAYPVIGQVTGGLDVVEKIGALPTVDNGSGAKVKPKTDVADPEPHASASRPPAPHRPPPARPRPAPAPADPAAPPTAAAPSAPETAQEDRP